MKKCRLATFFSDLRILLSGVSIILFTNIIKAQKVDYSQVSVPEENGLELMKITRESDYVCMPNVKRNTHGINWLTNRILAASPDGQSIAYLSLRDKTTNIFIKDIEKQSASRKRTNRAAVVDFTYSPDGKQFCFTETKGKFNQLFITDAVNGYVCKQITTDSKDYSPIYSSDMKNIFFTRLENRGASIWSFNVDDKFLSTYAPGMNPCPAQDANIVYIARTGANGNGEIWKINIEQGEEECIVSDPHKSFFSPMLSPNGEVLLMVGSSNIVTAKFNYWNTDIYTCNTDGTNIMQHTHHAADDLSPVWSYDGKYIYFISQRGNAEGLANIWRMTFNR